MLLFGQLCNRESLRDLVCALDAHHNKCYHLGFATDGYHLLVFATDGNHRGFIYYNLSIHDDDRISSTQVNSYSLCVNIVCGVLVSITLIPFGEHHHLF